MKMSIFILSLSIVLIVGTLIHWHSQGVKGDNAAVNTLENRNYLPEAQSDVPKVRQVTDTNYQKNIQQTEEQIEVYEKKITELKVQIAQEKKDNKTKYEKNLADLEQNNMKLKTENIDLKKVQVENWGEIQLQYRNDMDELGSSISGFIGED